VEDGFEEGTQKDTIRRQRFNGPSNERMEKRGTSSVHSPFININ